MPVGKNLIYTAPDWVAEHLGLPSNQHYVFWKAELRAERKHLGDTSHNDSEDNDDSNNEVDFEAPPAPPPKPTKSPTKRSSAKRKTSNYQVADFPDFGYLTAEEQTKYQTVWDNFCQAESVWGEMVPEEWQFLAYFESAFDSSPGPRRAATMNQAYTVLDALTMVFYGFGLGKWPRIKEYIQWCTKDKTSTIKQEVMDEDGDYNPSAEAKPKRASRKGASSKQFLSRSDQIDPT